MRFASRMSGAFWTISAGLLLGALAVSEPSMAVACVVFAMMSALLGMIFRELSKKLGAT